MKGKILMLFSLLIISLGSCESFLDLKPQGKTIPKTPEEYSAMIHQMIFDIENENGGFIMQGTTDIIDTEAISDNLDANIYLGQEMIPFYVGQRLNQTIYSKLYQNIRNCNIILDGLGNDETDYGLKVRSAAHAIRGVCYYELIKHYCKAPLGGIWPELGMPIVDEFNMEARPIRSSYEKTVAFINDDFKTALSIYNLDDPVYMFTSDVVKAYQARLYFWTGQWQKVIDVASELLDSYPVLSRDDYSKMVLGNASFPNMIVRYKNVLSQNSQVSDRVYTALRNRPVSIDFINIFDSRERDIRYIESINRHRNPIKLFIGAIRSEEMLLMAAESHYYLDGKSQAIELLNLLRSKRISDYEYITEQTIPSVTDNSVVMNDAMGRDLTPLARLIINERRKELFMEGNRFMDLKRLGSPESWVSRNGLAYTTKPFMYTWPIPSEDIELNPGIVQNEGYTEFIYN